MALQIISYTFIVLIEIALFFSPARAGNLNYTQCALIANDTYWKAPNDTFLYNQHGESTSDPSQAWGVSYESCKALCGSPDNFDGYDWNSLIDSFTSWLLPWLALTAQLPFETKDKQTNFMALILALGSPSLITFSLASTILNARSINRIFRQIKENNEPLKRPLQVKAIKAARAFLIESQNIPIQIYNGSRRELAQLVIRPENWAWWQALREEIQKTKREWTYSLYAQVGWVCVSQLLSVIDFFTAASLQTTIGIGLAINSLWIWMIPIVLGWVYVGTQTSAGSIRMALISVEVPVISGERNVSGDSVGIRDRTVFDDAYTTPWDRAELFDDLSCEEQPQVQRELRYRNPFPDLQSSNQEWKSKQTLTPHDHIAKAQRKSLTSTYSEPISSRTGSASENVEFKAISRDDKIGAGRLHEIEQQSQTTLLQEEFPSSRSRSFLGFSVAGCDLEPGPIFNYARIWSHMNAVEHVAEAFASSTRRQKARRTVSGHPWNSNPDEWDRNLEGSPEELSRYASAFYNDRPNLSVHAEGSPNLLLNSFTAALVAVFLQWSSTGAAIVIAYK